MRLLVAEDEIKVASHIKKGLEEDGYAVDVCYDGQEAYNLAMTYDYDLIILDIMLPAKNGVEVLKELRDHECTRPIIFLTAKNGTHDKIQGLDLGADDYLTKPFEFEELTARIRAILRRQYLSKDAKLAFSDLELDPVAHEVRRAGRIIDLTQKNIRYLPILCTIKAGY